MQALVLLHQTMYEHEWSRLLKLNGSTLRLGRVKDVVYQPSRTSRQMSIALQDSDAKDIEWTFIQRRDAMSMAVRQVKWQRPRMEECIWKEGDQDRRLQYLLPEELTRSRAGKKFVERMRGLTWLSAERMGPRDLYQLEDSEFRSQVGPSGEYAVSKLYSTGRKQIRKTLLCEAGVGPTLIEQVEAHMKKFFPGFVMTVDAVRRANVGELGVKTSPDLDFHRPAHTGFGISQVLPIIVAVLSSDPDGLLLIENPGVHLHPAGQSQMGEFLAEAANAEIQIVIETHSDHVLNGIRRAIKKGRLKASETGLYFFRSRHQAAESGMDQVESMTINAEGHIDNWPVGFFDQLDHDLDFLAGWD